MTTVGKESSVFTNSFTIFLPRNFFMPNLYPSGIPINRLINMELVDTLIVVKIAE